MVAVIHVKTSTYKKLLDLKKRWEKRSFNEVITEILKLAEKSNIPDNVRLYYTQDIIEGSLTVTVKSDIYKKLMKLKIKWDMSSMDEVVRELMLRAGIDKPSQNVVLDNSPNSPEKVTTSISSDTLRKLQYLKVLLDKHTINDVIVELLKRAGISKGGYI